MRIPTPDLQPWLARATKATATRKELADPKRSGRVAYSRRDGRDQMIKITPDRSLTTFKRLSSYLLALAKRALADLVRDGYEAPTAEQLGEELAQFAWTHHGDLIHVQAPGEPKKTGAEGWTFLSEQALDGAALKAAERALASYSWRPGALRDRQSAGGSKGKADGANKGPVPTKSTPENIALAKARRDMGKSQRDIASELGVSIGLVNRMLADVSQNRL